MECWFDKGNNKFSHGTQGINRRISFHSLSIFHVAAAIEMILSRKKMFSVNKKRCERVFHQFRAIICA